MGVDASAFIDVILKKTHFDTKRSWSQARARLAKILATS
jgi:hypothetical protein